MYSYNYNMPRFGNNMYYMRSRNNNQRFGGFLAPLFLGGVAGYAIGNNNNNNNSGFIYPVYPYQQYPQYSYYPYYPYNNNSNNNNYYYY